MSFGRFVIFIRTKVVGKLIISKNNIFSKDNFYFNIGAFITIRFILRYDCLLFYIIPSTEKLAKRREIDPDLGVFSSMFLY
jgi:hypothetical protein